MHYYVKIDMRKHSNWEQATKIRDIIDCFSYSNM